MGNKPQKHQPKEHAILMTGTYSSGKRTILEKLKQDDMVTSMPNTGYWGESFKFKNYDIEDFAIGGRCSMRPMLRYYYKDTVAVIFVVDSNVKEYIEYVKYELHSLLQEESLQDTVVLVLANKQDLPEAASVQEVIEILDLNDVKQEHCNIFGTCATTGEGLDEAFDWLSTALANKGQHTGPEEVETEQPGKPVDKAKGPKGYLKKLRASIKNAILS